MHSSSKLTTYLICKQLSAVYPESKARGVSFVLRFRRNVFNQLMSTYLPLTGNVITAFSAFWMSSQEVASRVNITAITLLAIFWQMTTFRAQLPQLPVLTVRYCTLKDEEPVSRVGLKCTATIREEPRSVGSTRC